MTDSSKKQLKEKEALLMEKLKSILLREEREKVDKLETIVENKKDLSERVDPIIEEHIRKLQTEFPDHYKAVVNRMMEQKIQESSEEIVNAIYPVLGQMIKKYISYQFQMLKDSIDQQINTTFSGKGMIGRIKASLFGVKPSEVILSNIDKPLISEVFVIQRNSGLLIASASVHKTIDQDVVAGMLTAIKSFVEDAFDSGQQSLGSIEYDTHKIIIQNFPNYYIAVAMQGSISAKHKDELADRLLSFAEEEITSRLALPPEQSFSQISKQLEVVFIGEEAEIIN